tara:strand:+ start:443 stop:1282 length:840 start_codon:yes stop_codon:yes gene_type:complete
MAEEQSSLSESESESPDFNFKEHLSSEYREHASLQDITSLDSMAKSYISAQEMVGQQRLPLPPVDADSETMDKFYDSIGRPSGNEENGYGYTFNAPEELPEGVIKDDKMEKYFRKSMHEAGLTQKQADQLYNSQINYMGEFVKQGKTNQETTEKDWDNTLRQDFGLAYPEQMEAAKQAVDKFGSEELREYFNQSRLGNHPEMIKFAAKVGTMVMESGSMGKGGRKGGSQLTPDQAKQEISNLQHSSDFMRRYNEAGAGHVEAVEQMQRLHNAAYPEAAE